MRRYYRRTPSVIDCCRVAMRQKGISHPASETSSSTTVEKVLLMIIRLVSSSDTQIIAAYHSIQAQSYADLTQVPSVNALPRILSNHTRRRQNFLLVAEEHGQVIGGTMFSFFPGPRVGFSFFIGTRPDKRGQGTARALHEERVKVFAGLAGPKRRLKGIFADVLSPERASLEDIERERQLSMDPIARRIALKKLGYRQVCVDYLMPDGELGDEVNRDFDLLFCPVGGQAKIPKTLIRDTLSVIWTPWVGRHRTNELLTRMLAEAPNTLALGVSSRG